MDVSITPDTVELVSNVVRPYVQGGVLQKTEHQSLLEILRRQVVGHKYPVLESDVLTIQQTAVKLSVSSRTVRRMLEAGELSGVYLRPGSSKTLRVFSTSVELVLRGCEKGKKAKNNLAPELNEIAHMTGADIKKGEV